MGLPELSRSSNASWSCRFTLDLYLNNGTGTLNWRLLSAPVQAPLSLHDSEFACLSTILAHINLWQKDWKAWEIFPFILVKVTNFIFPRTAEITWSHCGSVTFPQYNTTLGSCWGKCYPYKCNPLFSLPQTAKLCSQKWAMTRGNFSNELLRVFPYGFYGQGRACRGMNKQKYCGTAPTDLN